jgi:hypothetical protein
VEEAPNRLGRAQPPHTLDMGWKKEVRVPRGTGSPLYSWETRDLDMSRPGAGHVQLTGYVQARGQTCPVKTASTVLETSKTTQKLDIQRILA